jgi:hypothetical protein
MRRNKSQFSRQSNSKLIYYVIAVVAVLGIGIVILQDIQVPKEHVSQEIEVKLEK